MENPDSDKDTKKTISPKTEIVSEPGIVWQKKTISKKVTFSSILDQEQSNYLY